MLEEQLKELKMQSPIRELTKKNVLLFTDIDSQNLVRYQIFLQEHYDMEVYPVLDMTFGRYGIYHFEEK